MIDLWVAAGCLFAVCAILLWEECILHAKLQALRHDVASIDRQLSLQLKAQKIEIARLDEVERQAAANEAALELQEVSIDNHERALRAQENLSILHAESVTRLEGRVTSMERNPFHMPVRRDN